MSKFFFKLNYHLGLGDFYTSACEIFYIADKLKTENKSLYLFLTIKPEIKFFEIFEKKFYDLFELIYINDAPESYAEFVNFKCLFEIESWSLFGGSELQNLQIKHFNLIRPNLLNYTESDYTLKLSDDIIEKTKLYLGKNEMYQFCTIHFRCRDDQADIFNYIDSENLPTKIIDIDNKKIDKDSLLNNETIQTLYKILDDYDKIFVCSNCILIKNFLKGFSNKIVVLDENYLSTLRRNYADREYFELCILEFCIMSFTQKIFLFTNYSWISNFLSYGILSHNSHKKVNPYENNQIISIFQNFFNSK